MRRKFFGAFDGIWKALWILNSSPMVMLSMSTYTCNMALSVNDISHWLFVNKYFCKEIMIDHIHQLPLPHFYQSLQSKSYAIWLLNVSFNEWLRQYDEFEPKLVSPLRNSHDLVDASNHFFEQLTTTTELEELYFEEYVLFIVVY